MTATPNAVPQRLPAGSTTDPPYGPMADSGFSNPAFYHQFFDDFDNSIGSTGLWTVSKGSTGTAVHGAGDGGLVTLTTAATNADYVSMQLPAADFTLPQVATQGKKMFFLARFQLSTLTSSAIVGLLDTTATPFAAITDGIYFHHPSGGSVLELITVSASTAMTWAIPASAYTLAAATNIDVGFYIDRNQNINVFVGSVLVGWLPQSGTGAVNPVTGVTVLPVVGRQLQVVSSNFVASGLAGTGYTGPWTITTANLNPTIAVQAGSAAADSITADFIAVQKER